MLALTLINRVMTYAGIESTRVKIYTTSDMAMATESQRSTILSGDLVLVGSSFVKTYTDTFLNELFGDKVSFSKDESGNRFLNFFASPTVEERLSPEDPLTIPDSYSYGVLKNARNPLAKGHSNPRVIVVAGTRGFATWGAALAFREGPDANQSRPPGSPRSRTFGRRASVVDYAELVKCTVSPGGYGISWTTSSRLERADNGQWGFNAGGL
jgi:hypothetical protein